MPLPDPKPFERLAPYLNRCVPIEMDGGKDRRQATAICASNYKKDK